MQNGKIIGLQFNDLTRQEQDILVNSLTSGLALESGNNFVIVNKSRSAIPCSNVRQSKDNIFLRYGKLFKFADIIVLDKNDFANFGMDIKKITANESYREKNWLIFYDEIISDDSIQHFDSVTLLLKSSQSAVPVVYQYMKAMTKTGCRVPLKVIIYGEKYIEKAAEFFLSLKRDIVKLAGECAPVEFAGFLFVSSEEKDLLIRFNIDIPRAFPKSNLHGQIANCLRKIMEHNDSISSEPQTKRLYVLSG